MKNIPHQCPHCGSTSFIKKGFFRIYRINQKVRRYQCRNCHRTFTHRTFRPDYLHKKMDLNTPLAKLLTEGNSLRACARILGMTYKSTYKKFLWLKKVTELNKGRISYKAEKLQFDELETILHTKCKPLSIALVVNEDSQLIAAQVAEIPAKGRLASFSVFKYGPRRDDRRLAMEAVLMTAKSRLRNQVGIVESDAKSAYRSIVRKCLGEVQHLEHARKIDKRTLQERLHEKHQKRRYDPLFAINHQCARLRDRIKRLARRNWCTTKKLENLQLHLDLVIHMNQFGKI